MALMILTACSGTGKSTIVRALMARYPMLKLSVSHTTRLPRPGEINGEAYHFTNKAQFESLIAQEAFVEWAEYAGNYYGTSHQMILEAEAAGTHLLFEVDTVGAAALRKAYPQALSCFLLPPSWEELERRLRDRGTETQEVIQRRLSVSRQEITQAQHFDYLVVNDDLDQAIQDMSALYQSLLLRTDHHRNHLNHLLQ